MSYITDNFAFLADKLTNLSPILWHLIEHKVISVNEMEEIKAEQTPLEKNGKLLTLLLRKEIDRRVFLEILTKTNNQHCVNKIQQTSSKRETELKEAIDGKRFRESVGLAKLIDEELATKRTKFNYAVCLAKNGQLEDCIKSLEEFCPRRKISENPLLSKCLKILFEYWKNNEMTIGLLNLEREPLEMETVPLLFYSYLGLDKFEEALTIGEQIVDSIDQFNCLLSVAHIANYHLTVNGVEAILELDVAERKINFSDCSLSLSSLDGLSGEEIILNNVSFSWNGQELKEVTVNDFLDFHKINRLTLNCSEDKKNLSIDLSGEITMEYLNLQNVRVLNWKDASWNIQTFNLFNIPFLEKTKLSIKEMALHNCPLEISCLPQTIHELILFGRTEVDCRAELDLPHLKYLKLQNMSNSSSLSPFHSVPLTHVYFHYIEEVNVSLLPESVQQIKITNHQTKIVGGQRRVDKLILDWIPLLEMEEFLSRLHTDQLVIHKDDISPEVLQQLLQKEIKTIAVGHIKWRKEDWETLSKLFDTETLYYSLEGGRGRGLDWSQFEELFKLY